MASTSLQTSVILVKSRLVKSGSLRLEVQFDQALARTINVIVYAEFQSLIQVDAHRNVICDFAN